MIDRWLEKQTIRTLLIMFLLALFAVGAGITLLFRLLDMDWLPAILWGVSAIGVIVGICAIRVTVKVILRLRH